MRVGATGAKILLEREKNSDKTRAKILLELGEKIVLRDGVVIQG